MKCASVYTTFFNLHCNNDLHYTINKIDYIYITFKFILYFTFVSCYILYRSKLEFSTSNTHQHQQNRDIELYSTIASSFARLWNIAKRNSTCAKSQLRHELARPLLVTRRSSIPFRPTEIANPRFLAIFFLVALRTHVYAITQFLKDTEATKLAMIAREMRNLAFCPNFSGLADRREGTPAERVRR